MRNFDDSTLWRISAYERMRAETGDSGFARLGQSTVLPTTLHAELNQLEQQHRGSDVLEVVAACMRHQESALLLLRHDSLVWPLTLFPRQGVYHLPRPILASLVEGTRDLEVLGVQPPGLRPPDHHDRERVAPRASYLPLPPLLWALALLAPRAALLEPLAGPMSFRVTAGFEADAAARAGALGAALQRLRGDSATVAQIARWPGMDPERATRLLNGLYLQGGLMVLGHRPARPETGRGSLLDRWRSGL
jgi:hypothetical protein